MATDFSGFQTRKRPDGKTEYSMDGGKTWQPLVFDGGVTRPSIPGGVQLRGAGGLPGSGTFTPNPESFIDRSFGPITTSPRVPTLPGINPTQLGQPPTDTRNPTSNQSGDDTLDKLIKLLTGGGQGNGISPWINLLMQGGLGVLTSLLAPNAQERQSFAKDKNPLTDAEQSMIDPRMQQLNLLRGVASVGSNIGKPTTLRSSYAQAPRPGLPQDPAIAHPEYLTTPATSSNYFEELMKKLNNGGQ